MTVKLISTTPDAERLIAYMARVSNPDNQDKTDNIKLIKYLIKHKHWSPFEMANMCVEINTTRSISTQILRHRSFSFQEFSQRYADIASLSTPLAPDIRLQDTKNRQNSIDGLDPMDKLNWQSAMQLKYNSCYTLYKNMLSAGIAKECARDVLPIGFPTRLYMNGTIRSWIHYIDLRSSHGTQKEHMDIANDCKRIFIAQFPSVAEALEWNKQKNQEDYSTS